MLPELKDFNWFIDMKVIPGEGGQRIQQPSCILALNVNDQDKPIQVELSKETLNLVLENFTRIREQLNTLAQRQ